MTKYKPVSEVRTDTIKSA